MIFLCVTYLHRHPSEIHTLSPREMLEIIVALEEVEGESG